MSLKMRNAQMGDQSMELNNLMGVVDFKKKYVELLNSKELTKGELDPANIRMFAMGKELKDDLFIYSYDIINESTVQVMIRKT